MRTIELGGTIANGRTALVDDQDYAKVACYHWWAIEVRGGQRIYAVTQVELPRGPDGRRRRRTIYMHQLITGWPATDHRNHNGLDNRRRNLRRGHGLGRNQANQRPIRGGSSRFKGVHWERRRGHYFAHIKVDRRRRYLGSFGSDEEAAARAYDAAAVEAWGEYACLNFPPDQDPGTRRRLI